MTNKNKKWLEKHLRTKEEKVKKMEDDFKEKEKIDNEV
jgi:hypothetical protein